MVFSVVIVALLIINFKVKIKSRKNFYICTVIIFTFLGFFVAPGQGMDLQRHYETLDAIRSVGLSRMVATNYNGFGDQVLHLPVYALFFALVTQFPFNEMLLALTYAGVYGCQMAILKMSVKDFSLTKLSEKMGYMFILCMTNAFSATGIRNMLAFAVFALFFYLEEIRHKYKKTAWVVYLLLCLFHDSVIALVLMRAALIFARKKSFKWVIGIFAVWSYLIPLLIPVLSLFSSVPFISGLVIQLTRYTGGSVSNFMGSSGYGLMLAAQLPILFMTWYAGVHPHKLPQTEPLKLFANMIVAFCAGGLARGAIVIRFLMIAFFVMIPYFAQIFQSGEYQLRVRIGSFSVRKLAQAALFLMPLAWFVFLVVFQYRWFAFGLPHVVPVGINGSVIDIFKMIIHTLWDMN